MYRGNQNPGCRVGLTPGAVRELTLRGHEVMVEHAAGLGIGYDDEAYRVAGAVISNNAGPIFEGADLIVKVKGAAARGNRPASPWAGAIHLSAPRRRS